MRVRGGGVEIKVVEIGCDSLLLLSWSLKKHPDVASLTPAGRGHTQLASELSFPLSPADGAFVQASWGIR